MSDKIESATALGCFGLIIFGTIATGLLLGQSVSEKSHFHGEFHAVRGTIFKSSIFKVSTDDGYVYLPKINFHYGGNETVYTDVNGTVHVSFTGGHSCRMFPFCPTCSSRKSYARKFLDKHAYIGKTNTIYYKNGFKVDMYGGGHMSTCMYEGWLHHNFDSAITLYSVTGLFMLPCICMLIGALLYLLSCGTCSIFEDKPAYEPPVDDVGLDRSLHSEDIQLAVTTGYSVSVQYH
jgi:hypothetical protein